MGSTGARCHCCCSVAARYLAAREGTEEVGQWRSGAFSAPLPRRLSSYWHARAPHRGAFPGRSKSGARLYRMHRRVPQPWRGGECAGRVEAGGGGRVRRVRRVPLTHGAKTKWGESHVRSPRATSCSRNEVEETSTRSLSTPTKRRDSTTLGTSAPRSSSA